MGSCLQLQLVMWGPGSFLRPKHRQARPPQLLERAVKPHVKPRANSEFPGVAPESKDSPAPSSRLDGRTSFGCNISLNNQSSLGDHTET